MGRKKLEQPQHILDDHRPSVSLSECEFGDHTHFYCRCGWVGTDNIDDTYEYIEHLKEIVGWIPSVG